jgi:exopolysaccharide production protein ExoZ
MKIWSLQALRFWAALGVVCYHATVAIAYARHPPGLFDSAADTLGRAGVDIFFVLSGVIIAVSSQGLSAGAFVERRARRILPLYLMMTAIYLPALLWKGDAGWREVIASLTLWPAFDRIAEPVTPVAWTLCFEALFYAATALVLWRPRLVWLVLSVFAACLAIRSGPVTSYLGNPMILEFLLGVGLARLPKWRGAMALIPLGVAAILVFGSGYPSNLNVPDCLNGTFAWRRLLFLGLPAAGIVWGVLQIEGRKGLTSYLGETSYSLYLTHLPVVQVVVAVLCRFTPMPSDLVMLVAAGVSVAFAWRIHEIAEKPMIAWLRGLSERRARLTPAGLQAEL